MTPDDEPIEGLSPADAEQLAADEARGADAIAQLRSFPARTLYRDRLAKEFAAGTLTSRLQTSSPAPPTDATIAPPLPTAHGRPVVALPRRRSWRDHALRWGVPAAAAAALAVVSTLNPGKPWQVISAKGDGVAVVDGRPLPMNHFKELKAAIRPGTRVRVPPGCTLEIESGDALRMELLAEADATVPAPPGRWFGRRVTSEIHSGEYRITTGLSFSGAMLAIGTPSAHIEVRGTTLAVILDPDGTCVCVHEGTVKVGRDVDDMVDVPAGRRRFVFNDLRVPEMGDIRESEVPELERMKGSLHHH